jgi:hypothetical protein
MKKVFWLMSVVVLVFSGAVQAIWVTDPLNRDVTPPAERTTILNFYGNYGTTWQNDPLVSPSTDPYIFTGSSGSSYGYIKYAAPTGQYLYTLKTSIAYLGGANGIEVRDSNYNLVNFTKTQATQDANDVWWYTVTFERADNNGSDINYNALYIVVYFGSWGAAYSSIGTVQLEEQALGYDRMILQNGFKGFYEQCDAMMQGGAWGSAGYTSPGYLNYGMGSMFFEQAGGSYNARSLLKFNLEGLLPEGATVTRATLTLTLRTAPTPTPTNTIQLGAFRAYQPWTADGTCWSNWGAGGTQAGYCDFNVANGSVAISPTAAALSSQSMDLTNSMVQDWVDQPWLNYGVVLRQIEWGWYQFYVFGTEVENTAQASYAPQLLVEFTVPTGAKRLTWGHRTLLKKGLQITAPTFANCYAGPPLNLNPPFSMSRFDMSNSNNVDLVDPYLDPQWIQANPKVLWSRHSTWYDIQDCELPYIKNLVNMVYGDELSYSDLTNQTHLDAIKAKFDYNKSRYPNVINLTNQEGGQHPDDVMRNYISYCQPAMLMHDTYPFYGTQVGGSPPNIYEHMAKYRQLGLEGLDGTGNKSIPWALYTQLFTQNIEPWWGHRVSESEFRLNQFAAWAFGYKYINQFIYMNEANKPGPQSIMFTGDGDGNPTPEFTQVATLNRQSRNLGPALVRLISTDVRMKMGRHHGPRTHWYQIGVGPWEEDNSLSSGVSAWSTSADPYITNVSVSNPGNYNTYTKDDIFSSWTVRLPGDVILGFFKPLHESFDGPSYNNQKYFMIVNGLCNAVGNAAGTTQNTTIDFNFGTSGINSLQRMKRSDSNADGIGDVETITAGGSYSGLTFTSLGGSSYRLVLTLEGGTGDLFKYNTGAPFVGAIGQP